MDSDWALASDGANDPLRNAYLLQHQLSHSGERNFVCPHDACGNTYQRKDHLVRHVKAVHEDTKRAHVCDRCGAAFVYKHGLSRHVAAAHDNPARPYVCAVCQASFKKKSGLQAHAFVHTGVVPFPCPEPGCAAAFTKKCLLTKHTLSSHSGASLTIGLPDASVAFTCSVCRATLSSRKTLREHERLHESAPTRYPCPDCGKTYLSKTNLNSHRRTVHARARRFPCDFCLDVFSYKHVLQNHIARCHTNTEPRPQRRQGLSQDKIRARLLGSRTTAMPQADDDGLWMQALVDGIEANDPSMEAAPETALNLKAEIASEVLDAATSVDEKIEL
ncbi:hypothetical protein SPRG_01207 [Saprolegnia parasitica CBS 223.65]|uniref:C2H2-type domain-containing protein n=1 Tax=Saprolegnia parasitica (strain CBS 223.65) TaxID=695850 RepID=A0A067D0X4_SAPPC|nr:hypothetical protein SPRG_01207 [Saprolegnia parasitica CBS 223.65]KDO35140.1 hypothetical protein SPRG_01207 [Saprolegnia parasitica CBS 223.65]|eukprot:XP_012194789.1 hypothetical protein SPRG_01207 [Saprolegnia parasitica CBS 223.65]